MTLFKEISSFLNYLLVLIDTCIGIHMDKVAIFFLSSLGPLERNRCSENRLEVLAKKPVARRREQTTACCGTRLLDDELWASTAVEGGPHWPLEELKQQQQQQQQRGKTAVILFSKTRYP